MSEEQRISIEQETEALKEELRVWIIEDAIPLLDLTNNGDSLSTF